MNTEFSLLETRADGLQGFVHDTIKTFLAARHLAIHLNAHPYNLEDHLTLYAPIFPQRADVLDDHWDAKDPLRLYLLEYWTEFWSWVMPHLSVENGRNTLKIIWNDFDRRYNHTETELQLGGQKLVDKHTLELCEYLGFCKDLIDVYPQKKELQGWYIIEAAEDSYDDNTQDFLQQNPLPSIALPAENKDEACQHARIILQKKLYALRREELGYLYLIAQVMDVQQVGDE